MKQAILIYSQNFKKDKAVLEKYSTVREHKHYKKVRGYGHEGQWHLLVVEENDWGKICKKHKINYHQTFSEQDVNPFFVKITKCSPFCYPANKTLIGKTMQVMIDPVNSKYYLIYPALPIQQLCHSDGNYNRKGYIYGIYINDCIRVKNNSEEKASFLGGASNLLPCPFCGATPSRVQNSDGKYCAICNGCSIIMVQDKKAKLTKLWNRRK